MTYKDRLIAALETRRDVYAADSNVERFKYMAEGLDAAITIARATRPDDVRPVVKGKWKPRDLTWGRSYYYCSACEETVVMPTAMGIPMFRYCPNCGADMR